MQKVFQIEIPIYEGEWVQWNVWKECTKTSLVEIRTTSIMQRRHNLKSVQTVKLYIIAQECQHCSSMASKWYYSIMRSALPWMVNVVMTVVKLISIFTFLLIGMKKLASDFLYYAKKKKMQIIVTVYSAKKTM